MAIPDPSPYGWQPPQMTAARPPAINRAVPFMCTGAALAIAQGIVSGLVGKSLLVARGGPAASSTGAFIGGSVLAGLIIAGLWLWMAWKNREGRSWARVVSTVFFGIMCLIAIVNLFGLPSPSAFIALAEWAVGLAAIIFLWRGESSQYYRAVQTMSGYPPPPGAYGQPGYGQPPAPPPSPGDRPPNPYEPPA